MNAKQAPPKIMHTCHRVSAMPVMVMESQSMPLILSHAAGQNSSVQNQNTTPRHPQLARSVRPQTDREVITRELFPCTSHATGPMERRTAANRARAPARTQRDNPTAALVVTLAYRPIESYAPLIGRHRPPRANSATQAT